MEKLTDDWLKKQIDENRVEILGVYTLYHSQFSFSITIKPPKPWNPDSIWWSFYVNENEGKTTITKYESNKLSFSGSGLPDWDDRVEISADELKFWKDSELFHELFNKVVNKLEKNLNDNRVSYSLSHNHRDFSKTREILDRVIKNVVASKV